MSIEEYAKSLKEQANAKGHAMSPWIASIGVWLGLVKTYRCWCNDCNAEIQITRKKGHLVKDGALCTMCPGDIVRKLNAI